MGFRIGNGFDVLRLGEGRRCVICGVDIPFELGLLGHSDADVALHALTDALLGAAAMGDMLRQAASFFMYSSSPSMPSA